MGGDGKNVERLSAEGHNPAWSPDGREIAVGEDRVFDYEGRNHNASRLWAIDVTTKTRRLLTDRDAVQPNWSPHGHQVAYWGVHKGGQRDIWVVAAGGGKEPVAVTDDKAVDWNPVWGRDGRHLYFLSNRAGSMNLWRVAIDESAGRITGPPEPATLPSANSQHISFSGDGRALVYVEMNRQEATWQIPFDPAAGRVTGPEVQITHGVRRYSNPDLAPDEKSIVFVSQGEAQEDLYVVSRDGMQLRQLTNDPFLDRSPRWSPDGRRIAFVSDRSGKYEVWGVNDDGSDLARLTDVGDAEVISPVWSPDGRRLLYQARGVNSFVIEVGRGAPGAQTPQPLPGQQTPDFLPWSWSPDGSLLAGWTFKPNGKNGVVIYSFAAQSYRRVSDRGRQPIWLNDNRRLIYVDLGKMYLLDTLTGRERSFYSIDPDNFGTFMLSPDNRRLYFSRFSSEADVWLLSLD
jgi:Tol biopolymer transport system component